MTDVANLALRIDSSSAVLADKRLWSMTRTGGRAQAMFGRLNMGAGKLAAGLGIAGVAGAAFIMQKAFRESLRLGREFQENMSDLEAITGITGSALERIGEQAIASSKKTTQSAQDVVEAYKLVASQLAHKIDFGTELGQQQLQQVADDAITLSEAARIDLATAVRATTTAINQFNLEAEDATSVVNNLAAGSKYGAAEVGLIQEAMAEAGTAAAAAGEDINTTNAAIQVLAQNAITGGKAGTGLRNVFLRLQTEANRLADYGIENIDIKTNGLVKTLRQLRPIMNDSSALVDVFGRRVFNAVGILIKNVDTLEDLENKMYDTNTAFEQQSAQLDNLSGDIAKLSSSIEGDLITAFNNSRNNFRAVVQEIDKVWAEFGDDFIGVMDLIVSGTADALARWRGIFTGEIDTTLNIAEDSLLTTLGKLDAKISTFVLDSGRTILGLLGTVVEGGYEVMIRRPFDRLFSDGMISEENKDAMRRNAQEVMAAFAEELARPDAKVTASDIVELDLNALSMELEAWGESFRREAARQFADEPLLITATIDTENSTLVDEGLIRKIEREFAQVERLQDIFGGYDVAAEKAKILRKEIINLVESGEDHGRTIEELIFRYNLLSGEGVEGLRALIENHNKNRNALERTNEVAEDLGFTFESAFEEAVIGGGRLRVVLQGILDDIKRIALRMSISKPLGEAFGTFVSGLLPGSDSGGGTTNNATGGVFTGLSSVVDADGRKQVFGEAGPEAVLPLTRLPGGNLGVGSKGGRTKITIINYTGEDQVETRETQDANGNEEIEITIGRMVANNVRRGGNVWKAIRDVSGAQRTTRKV